MQRKKMIRFKLIIGIVVLVIAPVMMKSVAFLSNRKTTCIFDALGFKCLGCNILSALYKIKQGDFLGAFNQNPLVYIWIGLTSIIVFSEAYILIRRLYDKRYNRDSLLEWILKKMFKGITF